jgi:urease accessory protein
MKRARRNLVRLTTVATVLLPTLGLAHPGHMETSSFALGALHPLTGIDHVLGFIAAGLLAGLLGGRYLWPLGAAMSGLLVAAWTSDSEGWRYAAGFMTCGAALVAAGVTATRLCSLALTEAAPRSPTSAAAAAPTRRLSRSR